MRDEQLLAYLKGSCSGRKNRVGGTELERTLHVSGTDLRKLVNQLRRKTHPCLLYTSPSPRDCS